MKKHFNYFFIMAVLHVSAAVVSCEKEEDAHQGKYTMTVYATKSVNNSSKALSLDGTGLHATWTKDDVVKVYKGDIEVGSLKAASSGISTELSGSITGSIAKDDNLKLKFLSPNYNSQNGTLAYIAANCDYAEADVTVASISGENIRIEGSSAEFVNKQSIIKFILKNSDGSATLGNPEYLQVSNSSGVGTVLLSDIPASTYSTNGTSIVFVAIPGFENKNVTVDAYLNGSRYSFTKNNITLADGKYYEIMVRMTYMNLVDLSKVKNDVTLQDGTTVIGTLGVNRKISIADGATVTLCGATINGVNNNSYQWAGLNCIGDATIILADGTTNTVKGFYEYYSGIHIPSTKTLTIQGTGTLIASSNGKGTGIGGGYNTDCGNIIINGGTVTATGGFFCAGIGAGYDQSCGTITINGGEVTANGGTRGAGIGCTFSNGTCGDITINGGTVIANGGGIKNGDDGGAAGIGGGSYNGNCGNITISGGVVTATGGGGSGNSGGGAGIGGGFSSSCGAITISGGTVTANGGHNGVGIGGGYDRSCGDILISGGTVTATAGGNYSAGIGAGYYSSNGNITILSTVTRVTATRGNNAHNTIGISYQYRGSCGTVTIGGNVGAISTSPYTYEPGVPLASSSVGYRVCSDGLAYATNKTLPSGVTVIGVVARKSGSNGIVLYKQDNSDKYTWENRNSGNPSAVNVYVSNLSSTTSKSWTCGERSQYVSCGVDGNATNWSNLQTRLTDAGCEELSTTYGNLVYWTNTCPNGNDGWAFTYDSWTNYNKTNSFKVRPLFEF